jgi:hypothetical protein
MAGHVGIGPAWDTFEVKAREQFDSYAVPVLHVEMGVVVSLNEYGAVTPRGACARDVRCAFRAHVVVDGEKRSSTLRS